MKHTNKEETRKRESGSPYHNYMPMSIETLKRGGKFEAIDPEIRNLVKELVNLGYITVASCSGSTTHQKPDNYFDTMDKSEKLRRLVGPGYVNFLAGTITQDDKKFINEIYRKHGIVKVQWSSLDSEPIKTYFPAKEDEM